MSNIAVSVCGLTKDYGKGRGVFDLDFQVKQGECFGYVGTNGSGKTTTIRSIMGFIAPDRGNVNVNGKDAWKESLEVKNYVSYIPGEIAFPPAGTGLDFLKKQAEYMGITDYEYMNELLELFRLDASAGLSRMSKGMKQKTAIVAALMADREILILDEPTTGLDPLMREVFIDVINKEKKKGKTVFISNHIFEEVEELCDTVAFLKDGHIIDMVDMKSLKEKHKSTFHVGFAGSDEELVLTSDRPSELFEAIAGKDIKYIREDVFTLEDYFNRAYKGGEHDR